MSGDSFYIKENNILQLCLFNFSNNSKLKRMETTWEDEDGEYSLVCECSFGVPGAFEQDVYTAVMRLWIKERMTTDYIDINYSEIARELGISPKNWVGRIKRALHKLGHARYHFKQCFIKADHNGRRKINTHFSLFDSAELYEYHKNNPRRNSESRLIFPDRIKENLEAKYYQKLDMAYYKAFPSGLPRRLYEFLEKKRYHNIKGVFKISEEAICRWLPIYIKNITVRRKTLAKMAHALIEGGYLKDYSFDRRSKLCIYTYSRPGSRRQKQEKVIEVTDSLPSTSLSSTELRLDTQKKPVNVPRTKIKSKNDDFGELFSLMRLKRIAGTLREIVKLYVEKEGSAYVKRNILYANEKAKSSYSVYLQKALAGDWGKVWYEERQMKQNKVDVLEQQDFFGTIDAEEAIRIDLERQKQEEKRKEMEKQRLAEAQEIFVKKIQQLNSFIRETLQEKAEADLPKSATPHAIRLKFLQLLAEAVEEKHPGVVNMALAKRVWEMK